MSTTDDMVHALAASPAFAQDGVCFAARSSALYRSVDGGQTWRATYDSLQLTEPLLTTAVALSPAFVYDRAVFAGANGGILRSFDGGDTWQIVLLPEPAPFVTTIVVSPHVADDGVVLAGTLEDGVFRSHDRGSSWAAWNFGLLDLNVLCMAASPRFAHDETLFAGTGSGLFRSTNGGRAWREVTLPVECPPVLSVAFVPNAAEHDLLLVGTEGHGLFASRNNGTSWTMLGAGVLDGAINSIAGTTSTLIVLHNDQVMLSHDDGTTWSSTQRDALNADVSAIAAPLGLAIDAPLLAGMSDGEVIRR